MLLPKDFVMRLRIFCCLLLAFAGFLLPSALSAQSNCSYLIVANGGYTTLQIDQAMGAAQLDAYRFKTIRRPMKFANGAEVALYAADELQTMGCAVDSGIAMDDNTALDPNRRFEIHPSGVIYEVTEAVYKR